MDWKNKFDMIKNKVKTQLHAKGVDTLISLSNWFNTFDLDGSGKLNKVEFEKFVAKIGAFLTMQEYTTVYNSFDLDGDGEIHFKEFVQALRTDFAEKRLAVVKHAWNFLD
jgi:Ca2+-binding EF-hand superfamily protein